MKCALTKTEAQNLVSKFGGNVARAAASVAMPRTTLRRLLGTATARRAVKAAAVAEPMDCRTAEKTKVKGFALTVDTRVRDRKPTATLRSRFYELKRGTAYRESDLAKEWGVSPETVRKYAKDSECFAYVETRNEFWEACIMHPETAAIHLKNT